MTLTQILHAFAADTKVHVVLGLIAADIVFGIIAAAKTGTFAFSRLVDFGRDDLLGKVVPWFALYAFSKVYHGDVLKVVDFNAVADGFWAAVMLALGGSLATSFADLGVPVPALLARRSSDPKPAPDTA